MIELDELEDIVIGADAYSDASACCRAVALLNVAPSIIRELRAARACIEELRSLAISGVLSVEMDELAERHIQRYDAATKEEI